LIIYIDLDNQPGSEVGLDIQPGSEADFFDRIVDWECTGRDSYDVQEELKENGYGLSLKVGLKASNEDIKSAIVSSCLQDDRTMFSEHENRISAWHWQK
jgi:hypothetical protein